MVEVLSGVFLVTGTVREHVLGERKQRPTQCISRVSHFVVDGLISVYLGASWFWGAEIGVIADQCFVRRGQWEFWRVAGGVWVL